MEFRSPEAIRSDIELIELEISELQSRVVSLETLREALSDVSRRLAGLGTVQFRVDVDPPHPGRRSSLHPEVTPIIDAPTPEVRVDGDSPTLTSEVEERAERITEVFNNPVEPGNEPGVKPEATAIDTTLIPGSDKHKVERTGEGRDKIDQSRQAFDERVKTVGERARALSSIVRDAVLAMPDKFTMNELSEKVGSPTTSIRRHLYDLISQKVVIELDETRARESGGGPHNKLYTYNTHFPPGPTSRPKQPTPESQAVGATVTRGGEVNLNNGPPQVQDTMIQGFINAAVRQDWEVTWKDGNHLKFKSPTGRSVGVNARPPSKQVAMVIKRDLKRSGLRLA